MEELGELKSTIIIDFDSIIISCDFNIHLDDSDNSDKKQFISLLESFDFKHVTGSMDLKGHTLDLVFFKCIDVVKSAVLDMPFLIIIAYFSLFFAPLNRRIWLDSLTNVTLMLTLQLQPEH